MKECLICKKEKLYTKYRCKVCYSNKDNDKKIDLIIHN